MLLQHSKKVVFGLLQLRVEIQEHIFKLALHLTHLSLMVVQQTITELILIVSI